MQAQAAALAACRTGAGSPGADAKLRMLPMATMLRITAAELHMPALSWGRVTSAWVATICEVEQPLDELALDSSPPTSWIANLPAREELIVTPTEL